MVNTGPAGSTSTERMAQPAYRPHGRTGAGHPGTRRRLAACGVLAVLVGSAACDSTVEPSPPPIEAAITVDVRRETGALLIEYRLVNNADGGIVAFSGIPSEETHQDPAVDPDSVYVTVRRDGTVEFAKRVFGPPEGVGLAVDFVVRGTAMAPGESLDEAVRMPLPPTARHPYDDEVRVPADADRAVFCVGVARQDAVHPVPPLPDPTGTPPRVDADNRPSYPHRTAIVAAQQLVCGEPFDL